MKHLPPILLCAFTLLCAGSSLADEKKVPIEDVQVAILDTVVQGADASIGPLITERLAEVVGSVKGFSAISPEVIRGVLENEANKQLAGCDDESCLTELASALGASEVVSCRVAFLDGGFGISLTRIDTDKGKALGRINDIWRGESIRLLELIGPMVKTLYGKMPIKGAIAIENALPGSQIFVDDTLRGTAPAGQIGDLALGAHVLLVTKDGHEEARVSFILSEEGLKDITIKQAEIEESVLSQWWFWTAAGATTVVAAGAVAGAVYLGTSAGGGATGINIDANTDVALGGSR